jgi:hypothetical protein
MPGLTSPFEPLFTFNAQHGLSKARLRVKFAAFHQPESW